MRSIEDAEQDTLNSELGEHIENVGLDKITCTIRKTRNTSFVQFTYKTKRISREQAKEIINGWHGS